MDWGSYSSIPCPFCCQNGAHLSIRELWASLTPRRGRGPDSSPVPWTITFKDGASLEPGQSSSAFGFCARGSGGMGFLVPRLLGCCSSVSGHLDPNSERIFSSKDTTNKKIIKSKRWDKDRALMTYASSGKSQTLNRGLASYDRWAKSGPPSSVQPRV